LMPLVRDGQASHHPVLSTTMKFQSVGKDREDLYHSGPLWGMTKIPILVDSNSGAEDFRQTWDRPSSSVQSYLPPWEPVK
jgi:hypothetical protein